MKSLMKPLIVNIANDAAQKGADLGMIRLLEREREREREREVIRQLRSLALHIFIINTGAENFFSCGKSIFCVAANIRALPGNFRHDVKSFGRIAKTFGRITETFRHIPKSYRHHPETIGQCPETFGRFPFTFLCAFARQFSRKAAKSQRKK